MADGTDNSRILSSVASIASRSRDAQNTVAKVKPNSTPPIGASSGTITMLDAPVTVVSLANSDEFTWQTANAWGSISSNPKAIWLSVYCARSNATTSGSVTVEIRRDNFSITPAYTVLYCEINPVISRVLVPLSQSGTFEYQMTFPGATTTRRWDLVMAIEGFLS